MVIKTEDINIIKTSPPPLSCRKRKYKGVRMRSWGSWVSEIRAPNQKTRIWLGSYSTAEAAARAYDAALLCLKGSSANLNFPITSSPYIPDTIMSPKSIQRVAAAAAAAATTTTATDTSTITTPAITSTPSTPSTPEPLQSTSPASFQAVDTLPPFWPNYSTTSGTEEWFHPSPVDPWINFDDCSIMFPHPTIEDFYEEGDINLWSFC